MGCLIGKFTDDRVITYDEAKAYFRTGDIILFGGTGWFSYAIMFFTLSPFTHIGLVYVDEDYEFTEEGHCNIYLYHSVNTIIRNPIDVVTGKPKSGPQLSRLRAYFDHYDGDIVWRPVRYQLSDTIKECFLTFIRKETPKCYEQDQTELYNSVLELNKKKNTKSYFCSELVAEMFIRAGMLSKQYTSNNYLPKDFTRTSLKGSNGWYKKEILLKVHYKIEIPPYAA